MENLSKKMKEAKRELRKKLTVGLQDLEENKALLEILSIFESKPNFLEYADLTKQNIDLVKSL